MPIHCGIQYPITTLIFQIYGWNMNHLPTSLNSIVGGFQICFPHIPLKHPKTGSLSQVRRKGYYRIQKTNGTLKPATNPWSQSQSTKSTDGSCIATDMSSTASLMLGCSRTVTSTSRSAGTAWSEALKTYTSRTRSWLTDNIMKTKTHSDSDLYRSSQKLTDADELT